MPAKDRYHDAVKRALEKDSWRIKADPVAIPVDDRFVYIDILTYKDVRGPDITHYLGLS